MNFNKEINYKDLDLFRKNFKKKIVLAHGTFDFFHYGHLLHLQQAKTFGDKLVVSITSDLKANKGPGRPLYSINERVKFLLEFSFIDHVVVSNFSTAIEVIKKLKPDVYVKGIEYKDSSNDFSKNIIKERTIAAKYGAKIKYTDKKVFSSSNIINLYTSNDDILKKYFLKIKKKIDLNYFGKVLDKIKKKNILVIGESIFDEYIFCEGLGKSPKEEIISTRVINKELYLGGILATASHIANFCNQVTLLTVLGDNSLLNKSINTKLNKKIKKVFFEDKNIKTIIKTRYLQKVENKKLFQCNDVSFHSISDFIEKKIIKYIKKNAYKYDGIIINDFGHGLMTKNIINLIQRYKNKLCVNVQSNSANLGYNYFYKYKSCSYLSVDEPEARLGVGDRFCSDVELFKKVYKKTLYKYCSITHGGNGAKLSTKYNIFHAPALTKKFIDTLGAGDAYFAISSLFVINKEDPDLILLSGNMAGSLKISYLGHEKYLNKDRFYSYFKSLIS